MVLAVELAVSDEQLRQAAVSQVAVDGVHHLLPFAQSLQTPAQMSGGQQQLSSITSDDAPETLVAPEGLPGPHGELRHAWRVAIKEVPGVLLGLYSVACCSRLFCVTKCYLAADAAAYVQHAASRCSLWVADLLGCVRPNSGVHVVKDPKGLDRAP